MRQALPEGYYDSYIEGWGDGAEHGEEEEVREGIDEDNENEEGHGANQGEEIDKDETGDAWDEVQAHAHRNFSPLRTRLGKTRN